MFGIFKSYEEKRIKMLFEFYKSQVDSGVSEDDARLLIIGEMKQRLGRPPKRLNDDINYSGATTEVKKQLVQDLYSIGDYDIFKTIAFIIIWEFPEKYNVVMTEDMMRNRSHPSLQLDKKVQEIGDIILR